VKPTSDSDRLRLQLAIEAAVAEALRRRKVVRWSMLAFALFAALVIAALLLFCWVAVDIADSL
jgi:hypothetical protein